MFGKGGRKMERYTNALILQQAGTTVTANGTSATYDVSRFAEGVVVVNVTAVSGTSPSMDLFIDTYDPINNVWAPITKLTGSPNSPISTVNSYAYPINNYGRTIRLRWQLSGTNPSFTFSAVFVSKS